MSGYLKSAAVVAVAALGWTAMPAVVESQSATPPKGFTSLFDGRM